MADTIMQDGEVELIQVLPATPVIQDQLARSATKTNLLEKLLSLAIRRDREQERLVRTRRVPHLGRAM